MGGGNTSIGGKLEKHEKPRKTKKNNKKKDFDLNGKYNQKSVRKMEKMIEIREKKNENEINS